MPPTGDSLAYVAATGHLDIPRADGHVYRAPHTPKKKPTGLNWDALTPTCKGCGQKSGQLDATSHCPTCCGDVAKPLPTAATGRNQTYAEAHPDDLADRFNAPTEPLVDLHLRREVTLDDLTKLPTAGNQGEPTTRPSAPRATSTSSTSGRAPDAGSAAHREKNPPATQETRPAVAGGPDSYTPEANLDAQLAHAARVLRTTAASAHPAVVAARTAAIGTLESLHLVHELTKTPVAASSKGVNAATGHTSAAGIGKGKPARRPAPAGPTTTRRAAADIDEAAVIREYQVDGDSAPTIAGRHGCTPKRIRSILDRHGIARRDDRGTKSGGKRKADDPDFIAAVRRLYVDQQLTQSAVAEQLGVSVKVVWRVIRNASDIEARPSASAQSQHGIGHPTKIPADQRQVIADRYRAGEPGSAIAATYGCSTPTVYAVLDQLGVPRRTKSEARRLRTNNTASTGDTAA